MALLKDLDTHAQWRKWVEHLVANHMPLTDDKDSVLLLVLLHLQHFTKILKDSSNTLISLNTAYRRLLRTTVEKDHGKHSVDHIMDLWDSWPQPFKAPFCLQPRGHPNFPANILADVGSPQLHPTPLMEDNRACRALSESPITSRSRHIDFRVMSLRERVADGIVKVYDCPTHDMLADPFTKSLPREPFERHRQVLLGQAPSSSPFIHISGQVTH